MILGMMTFLLLITAVYAEDMPMCQVPVTLGEDCVFVTPSINCSSYTYDVMDLTGIKVLNSEPMALLNDSIYYFNFTLTDEVADYEILLCDGTTREISIERDGDRMIATVLGLLGCIFILLVIAFGIKEHEAIRLFFIMAAINMIAVLAKAVMFFDKSSVTIQFFSIAMKIVYLSYLYVFLYLVYWFFIIRVGKEIKFKGLKPKVVKRA